MSRPLSNEESIAREMIDILNRGATVDPRKSQSPIESRMLNALLGCGFNTDVRAHDGLGTLWQQHSIDIGAGCVHVDFAVTRKVGLRRVRIAIEVDGHEFHQRTKEQVERDYQRGRELARVGWIVIRFTGSEVWRDAGACALEVSGILIEAVDRIRGTP
jgi:very-short-patch-repair endonuclease